MPPPAREGIDIAGLQREIARLDRQRAAALRKSPDPTDSGGAAVIWYRTDGRLRDERLAIQPGVADDLPSLLSALAPEIGWPGTSATATTHEAVALLARVWQVREQADLRLLCWWDVAGVFSGQAELVAILGNSTRLVDTTGLIEILDRVAVAPEISASPHSLLLAGNRAMQGGDYAEARDYYERALHDLPRHPEARRNYALTLARLGQWEDASTAMRQAIVMVSKDTELTGEYLALETDAGIAAAQQEDYPRAAGHFLRILNIIPGEPTALANLGNIRLREGRLPEARAIFRRFLRHHPRHPAAEKIRLALQEIGEG